MSKITWWTRWGESAAAAPGAAVAATGARPEREEKGPRPLSGRLAAAALACALLSPAGVAVSGAADTPPGQPAPAFIPETPAPPPPVSTAPAAEEPFISTLGKRADRTHGRLEQGILKQVIRLDDFFGTIDARSEEHRSFLLRWRNGLRLEEGGRLTYGTSVRADVNLSRISHRLRLSISGDSEPEPFAPSLPEDPGNPGFDRTFQNTRIVNTELRYTLIQEPSTDCFVGAGVRIVFPPEVFLRARYQYAYHLSELSLLRFGETVFVKSPDGPGETTEFTLERSLTPKTLLRWANSATLSQEIEALEWGSELSLIRELSPRDAITFTSGVYGNSSVTDWITNYRLLARYRRNFLRSWLFYEIEPEVTWPRQADGSFPARYALTVRLEVIFQGKEQKMETR